MSKKEMVTRNKYFELVQKYGPREAERRYDILPLDLSEYHLSDDTKRLADRNFMEEKTDRNGHYMLAGHWIDNYCCRFAEKCALDLVMINCYQAYAYSDEQMVVFDYCEGDITLKPFTDKEAYEKEKAETIAFYRKETGIC